MAAAGVKKRLAKGRIELRTSAFFNQRLDFDASTLGFLPVFTTRSDAMIAYGFRGSSRPFGGNHSLINSVIAAMEAPFARPVKRRGILKMGAM